MFLQLSHTKVRCPYFFYDISQVAIPAATAPALKESSPIAPQAQQAPAPEFAHNEIRDMIAEIGDWLGFATKTEQYVSQGARVDVVWEATIGNMGRVLYVFEVQVSGSIDSLAMNLLRAIKNPAVQAVVAVSDDAQLEKIRTEVATLPDLPSKLRYWDYREVLENHAALSGAFESINRLKLVPDGF